MKKKRFTETQIVKAIKEHENGRTTQCVLEPEILKHCVVNLLTNAIKYKDDQGQVNYETEIKEDRCYIRIKDNGIGIPKEDQVHLFEPFFRATNTGNIPGTGLGLNIVDRYVRLMHGIIRVKSSIRSGTLFELIFPVQPDHNNKPPKIVCRYRS